MGLLAPLDPLGNGWRVVASRAFYFHARVLSELGVYTAIFTVIWIIILLFLDFYYFIYTGFLPKERMK